MGRGRRLGTFLFPPALRWLLDAMSVVASETFTTTSAPIQHAVIQAYQGGRELDDYLANARRILGALGPAIAARLRQAGCHLPEPEGGFYLFPDFSAHRDALRCRGIVSSTQLSERLLEEAGVACRAPILVGLPPSLPCALLTWILTAQRRCERPRIKRSSTRPSCRKTATGSWPLPTGSRPGCRPESVEFVARMERSEIREHQCPALDSASLHPGYS